MSTQELMDMIMMDLDFRDYDIVSYYVNIIKSLVNHAKEGSLFIFYNSVSSTGLMCIEILSFPLAL